MASRQKQEGGPDETISVRIHKSGNELEATKQGAAIRAALGGSVERQECKRILKEIKKSPSLSEKFESLLSTMERTGGKRWGIATFDAEQASSFKTALEEKGVVEQGFFESKAKNPVLSSIPVPKLSSHQYITATNRISLMEGFTSEAFYDWAKEYGGRTGKLSLGYSYNPKNNLSGTDFLWQPLGIFSSFYSSSGTGNVGLKLDGTFFFGAFGSHGLGVYYSVDAFKGGIPKLITTPPKDWDNLASSLGGAKPKLKFDAMGGPIGDAYSLGKLAAGTTEAGVGGVMAVAKAAIDIGYSIGKRLYEAIFPTYKKSRIGDALPSEKSHVSLGTATMEECVSVLRYSGDEGLKKKAAEGIEGLFRDELNKYASSGSSSITLTDLERLCKFISQNASLFSTDFIASAYAYRDSRRLMSKQSKSFTALENMATRSNTAAEGMLGNYLSSLFSVDELAVGVPLGIRWHGANVGATLLDTFGGWFEGLFQFQHTKQSRTAAGKITGAAIDVAGDLFDFAKHVIGTFSPVFFRSDARKEKVRKEIMKAMDENERLFSKGASLGTPRIYQNLSYLSQMLPYVANDNNTALSKKMAAHFTRYSVEYEAIALDDSLGQAYQAAMALASPGIDAKAKKGLEESLWHSCSRAIESYIFLKSSPEPKNPAIKQAMGARLEDAEKLLGYLSDAGFNYKELADQALANALEIRQGGSGIAQKADALMASLIKENGDYSSVYYRPEEVAKDFAEINGLSNLFNVHRAEVAALLAKKCDRKMAKEAIGLTFKYTTELVDKISDGIKEGMTKEELSEDYNRLSNQLFCLKQLSVMFPEEYAEKYYVLSNEIMGTGSVNARIRNSLSGVYGTKAEKSVEQFKLGYMILMSGALNAEDQQSLGASYYQLIRKNSEYKKAAEEINAIGQQ